MRRVTPRLLVTLLGGVLALCTLLPAAANAAAPSPAVVTPHAQPVEQDLGGETLLEFCQSLGYTTAFSSSGTWFCSGSQGTVVESLDLACRWQFADLASAGYFVYNVNGHCKTVSASAARISDLGRIGQYCQSLGYANATANAAGVVQNNVAAWRCVDSTNGSDGVEFKIDLHAACRWVNAAAVAEGFHVVSYFPNYGAYLELTCIGVV